MGEDDAGAGDGDTDATGDVEPQAARRSVSAAMAMDLMRPCSPGPTRRNRVDGTPLSGSFGRSGRAVRVGRVAHCPLEVGDDGVDASGQVLYARDQVGIDRDAHAQLSADAERGD